MHAGLSIRGIIVSMGVCKCVFYLFFEYATMGMQTILNLKCMCHKVIPCERLCPCMTQHKN